MTEATTFEPQWFSPPGTTIKHILESEGKSINDFASEIKFSRDITKDLIDGSLPIDEDLANILSTIFSIEPGFWLSRENQYRKSIKRVDKNKKWLKEVSVTDLIRYRWIKECNSLNEKIEECFKFFDVLSIDEWVDKYKCYKDGVAFRKSSLIKSINGATISWLRMCEIEANKVSCCEWDPELLNSKISEIRSLTIEKDPTVFLPRLKSLFAACGVALVVVRTPSGCPASGATRFLSKKKAVIMLSFRYLSDDHFWFTVFHEIGHLLLHSKDKTAFFIECKGNESKKEVEANIFSEEVLIPQRLQKELEGLSLRPISIARFAKKAGISPGIVVGQLQYKKKIGMRSFNSLKARYVWQED